MLFLGAHRLQIIRALLRAALVLFVLSLILPSVSKQQNFRLDLWCKAPVWEPGFGFLLFGPLGFLDAQFGWIANPLMLFAALIKIRKPGFALPAAILSAAIAAVAFTVFTAFSYTRDWHDGGVGITVCGFGPGYYLWLACSILVLIATLLKVARRFDASRQE
ncbi:hypothetical protein CQ14_33535 [Bradyrhizobium lablabi]|uniref:Transmembrane protein n=1 Tax=Bradyrhizobium lablabi TaxID=722472 RepID=A0A0R3MSX8_9BRAD|nr:hypothetical protein [Bradyrhizobium lablabi]KRR23177.1 hypothetical protein CQ14_33535 [Bradyrhizobium lablabi]